MAQAQLVYKLARASIIARDSKREVPVVVIGHFTGEHHAIIGDGDAYVPAP